MTPYPLPMADLMSRPPMDRVALDGEGLPVFRYGGAFDVNRDLGIRRNVTTMGWWALAARERSDPAFLRIAEWLRDRMDAAGSWSMDYPYRIGDALVTPPFICAQDSGVAISVLIRAHALAPTEGYLETALKALSPFLRSDRDGGLRFEDEEGFFYGLRGARPVPLVFDGIAFATLGLHDLATATGSPEAGQAFQVGAECLASRADRWRFAGNWSRMWIGGPPCSGFYHRMNALSAVAVNRIAPHPALEALAKDWGRGLANPWTWTLGWLGEKGWFLKHSVLRHT